MRRIAALLAAIVLFSALTGCAMVGDLLEDIEVFRDLETTIWTETLADAKNAVLDKDYERAAGYFRELAEMEPEDVDIRLWLGRCLLMAEDFEEAVTALQQAETREPENTDVLKYLAKAYASSGDTQLALDTYLKLRDIDPDSPAVLLGLQQIYTELGDEEALAELYGTTVTASNTSPIPDDDGTREEGVSYDEYGNPVYDDYWPEFGPSDTDNLPWDDASPGYEPEPVNTPQADPEDDPDAEPTPAPTPEPYDPNRPIEESEYGWDEYGG